MVNSIMDQKRLKSARIVAKSRWTRIQFSNSTVAISLIFALVLINLCEGRNWHPRPYFPQEFVHKPIVETRPIPKNPSNNIFGSTTPTGSPSILENATKPPLPADVIENENTLADSLMDLAQERLNKIETSSNTTTINKDTTSTSPKPTPAIKFPDIPKSKVNPVYNITPPINMDDKNDDDDDADDDLANDNAFVFKPDNKRTKQAGEPKFQALKDRHEVNFVKPIRYDGPHIEAIPSTNQDDMPKTRYPTEIKYPTLITSGIQVIRDLNPPPVNPKFAQVLKQYHKTLITVLDP